MTILRLIRSAPRCASRQFRCYASMPIRGELPPKRPIEGVKKVIAVASGKGGVGKSTIAVNLAIALSKLNHERDPTAPPTTPNSIPHSPRIGVLDADVFGPSIPTLLNLTHREPMVEKDETLNTTSMIPLRNHGVYCISTGFLVRDNDAMIWRGPMVINAINQLLYRVRWPDLDILVVDLPPGTGDVHLSLTQQVPLDASLIVTTPSSLSFADVRRGVAMFTKVKVPILGIVENMNRFQCGNCGAIQNVFGDELTCQLSDELNLPILASIPISHTLASLSDNGMPICVRDSLDTFDTHNNQERTEEEKKKEKEEIRNGADAFYRLARQVYTSLF